MSCLLFSCLQLRKYRAICTVEMLRATWEKTSNPYIRLATHGDRPKVAIKRRFLLPRPKGSSYQCVLSPPQHAFLHSTGAYVAMQETHDGVDLL